MVDMAFVHGMERSAEIINERISANNKTMESYETTCKKLDDSLHSFKVRQSYANLYNEYNEENRVLYSILAKIENEVDRAYEVDKEVV